MIKQSKNFDIDSFVDDCFQFVSEHDPNGPVNGTGRKVKKVRGAERMDNTMVNLRSLLNNKKQRVMKVITFCLVV
jgi:hypothetical protein